MEINDKSGLTSYAANADRYHGMHYRRCGSSGLQLPAVSLGLWHNFGHVDRLHNARMILRTAFDHGVVHWDIANNYGPPYGSAEENLGRLLHADFAPHRDELVIATKAGYDMWPGPYGAGGSRKYLVTSLEQSLRRMGVDYVDIFYHHCPDPETPLEESLGAIRDVIRQGKALYAGVSNYDADMSLRAADFFADAGVPFVLNQSRYSMLDRHVEPELLDALDDSGAGCIAFSPLAQGLLTDRYLDGIPDDSRAARPYTYLDTDTVIQRQTLLTRLSDIATARGQRLAQLAIAWLLRRDTVTSVLVGASSPAQLVDSLAALENTGLGNDELAAIDTLLEE